MMCSTPGCGNQATCRTNEPGSRLVLIVCAGCAHVAATMGHSVKVMRRDA